MFNKKLKLEIEGLKTQIEVLETELKGLSDELRCSVDSIKDGLRKNKYNIVLNKCVTIMRKHGASELMLSKYEVLLDGLYNRDIHCLILSFFMVYSKSNYRYYDSFETFNEYSKSLNFNGIYNPVNLYDINDKDMLRVLKYGLNICHYIYGLIKIRLTEEQVWLLADLVMYINTMDKFKNEQAREKFDKEHTQVVINFMNLYVFK